MKKKKKDNNTFYVDVDGQRAMIDIEVINYDKNSLKSSIDLLDTFIKSIRHLNYPKTNSDIFIFNISYCNSLNSFKFYIYTNYINDDYNVVEGLVLSFGKFLLDKYSLYCSEVKENADLFYRRRN